MRHPLRPLLPREPNGGPPLDDVHGVYVVELPSGSIIATSIQDLYRRMGRFASNCTRHALMPDVEALQRQVADLTAERGALKARLSDATVHQARLEGELGDLRRCVAHNCGDEARPTSKLPQNDRGWTPK